MNKVCQQRLGVAIAARAAGVPVTFHLEGGFPVYLVWHGHRTRHVISSGPRRGMEELLEEVRREFARAVALSSASAGSENGIENGKEAGRGIVS